MAATAPRMRFPGEPYKEEKKPNIFQSTGSFMLLFIMLYVYYGISFASLIFIIWFIYH